MKKYILAIISIIIAFSFLSPVKAETSITITDKLEFNSINDLKDKYPNTYNKAKGNIEVLKNHCREKYGNDFKYFAYYDNTYDFNIYENGEKVYSSLTCWNYKADVGNDTFNFYVNNSNHIFGHLSFLTKDGYLSLYNFSDNPNNINERELNYNYNEDVIVIHDNVLFIDRSIYWVDTNVDEIVFDSHEPQFNSYVSLIDSVQLNGNIYKKGDVILKNGILSLQPKFSYEIKDNDIGGKDVYLYYQSMNDDYYTDYYNLIFSEVYPIQLDEENKFIIKNVNLDTIITVRIYDKKTNEVVFTRDIDLNNIDINLKKDPYIKITGYNINNQLNSVFYSYFNIKKGMKCFYKYADEDEHEEDCSASYIKQSNKNTYLQLYIKKDNKVIYKRNVNLNFLVDQPQIKFNSYYDSSNNIQVVDIKLKNTQSGDTFYYSYDNLNWEQFNEVDKRLDFYSNTDLYVKIRRNNEDVAKGYIYVIYKSFENGNPTGTGPNNDLNNIFKYFDSLAESNKDIANLFQNIWNYCKSSQITIYFLISILGAAILLLVSALNRK